MATQPTFAWSSSGGTVTSGGVFTAPNSLWQLRGGGQERHGRGHGRRYRAGRPGLEQRHVGKARAELDADGSISRQDMIQILTYVANNGPVTAENSPT